MPENIADLCEKIGCKADDLKKFEEGGRKAHSTWEITTQTQQAQFERWMNDHNAKEGSDAKEKWPITMKSPYLRYLYLVYYPRLKKEYEATQATQLDSPTPPPAAPPPAQVHYFLYFYDYCYIFLQNIE